MERMMQQKKRGGEMAEREKGVRVVRSEIQPRQEKSNTHGT